MATQIQRMRIRPLWKGGLRHGTVRDTMTAYMAEHPEFVEELRQIHLQLKAWDVEQLAMEGVRQPFDYVPRRP